jgi:hypothetical protein
MSDKVKYFIFKDRGSVFLIIKLNKKIIFTSTIYRCIIMLYMHMLCKKNLIGLFLFWLNLGSFHFDHERQMEDCGDHGKYAVWNTVLGERNGHGRVACH